MTNPIKQSELPVRLVLVDPPPGFDYAGLPNSLGPFAQGPPAARFVYVDVGTYAGQKNTPWARRMKVPLRMML